MYVELTPDEIERILAYQRVAYLHFAEILRLGQTTDPAWDSRDDNILRKLTETHPE